MTGIYIVSNIVRGKRILVVIVVVIVVEEEVVVVVVAIVVAVAVAVAVAGAVNTLLTRVEMSFHSLKAEVARRGLVPRSSSKISRIISSDSSEACGV